MSYLKVLFFIPLFLIQPVFGQSEECRQAEAAYNKALSDAFRKAKIHSDAEYDAIVSALDTSAYDKALSAYRKACMWGWDPS